MEDTLIKTLDLDNPFAQDQLKEGFQRYSKTFSGCKQRTDLFRNLQTSSGSEPPFAELAASVKQLQPLLRESTTTEKEGYSQVCFQGSPWSGLNSIPFALTFLSIYKTYIVPGFSILMPVLACFLPYILLKAFFSIPIKFSEYTAILWRMWNGQALPKKPEDLLRLAKEPQQQTDLFTRLKQLAQNGWTLFTVGQTMWQPIQQARHFQHLDKECLQLGSAIHRVKGIAANLFAGWKRFLPSWLEKWIDLCPDHERQAFAFVIDNPFWLPHTLRALGRFEVLYKLAKREDVCAAEFVQREKPLLLLEGFGDPSIPFNKRKLSSLILCESKGSHAIVTGPNRGGKSSFMRGVLTNVKLAHSFGCCFSSKAKLTPFTWIADGLRLDDLPGKESMFEREVSFASGVLQKTQQKPFGLVLYDELFHSTNPPDAKRTSELFCSSLWKSTNCVSLVSTHIYSLAESAPPSVKKLCLASWRLPSGKYKFSYKVQKGICEISSVDLLLKQFGLLGSASLPSEENSASDQK